MSQERIDLAALSQWMAKSGLGNGKIENWDVLSGGTQNVLVRFKRAGREYVLRRPPWNLRDNSNETMLREARVLTALADTGVPHPELIKACDDQTVLGAAFYLMEPIDGFNPVSGLPSLHVESEQLRHRMGLALVDAIAKLSEIDFRKVGLEGFGKPEGFLERQVPRWQSQLASYDKFEGWTGPQSLPGVNVIADWLQAHRPATFAPGLMHGDYHLANVMFRFDGPEIAAIVDWELATIGDPLIDLGWLLATWPEDDRLDAANVSVQPWSGFPDAGELVEHYAAQSNRDVSNINWYVVLACFKLGIILEGTHARACAGLAPVETGQRLHVQAIRLFERACRRIDLKG